MSRRVPLVLVGLLVAAAAASCADPAPATGPASPASTASRSNAPVASSSVPGFHFLPPLAPHPRPFSGSFDAALDPEVRVCPVVAGACGGADVAVLTTGGTGASRVRVDDGDEAYVVVWHTRDAALDPRADYRLRVVVDGHVLGAVRIDVVTRPQELKSVGEDVVGLVQDHPLVIRFRIESGIVAEVRVAPPASSVNVGAAQRFTATVIDLHGEPLDGRAVAWSSSHPDIATIDASGLAIGVSAGAATITATRDLVTGTATLAVHGVVGESLSAGGDHTCGLTVGGLAYCWGYDRYGQLGDGGDGYHAFPVAVEGGLTFRAISSGGHHSCALTATGAVYCWGMAAGARTPTEVPTDGGGSQPFRQIAAGGRHTCALTAAGLAFCWGGNFTMQLGDGTTTDRETPTAVANGLSFQQLAAGEFHTCGIDAGGAAYCWGLNENGQLGDGTATSRPAPSAVSGGLRFVQIRAGRFHTCALTSHGAAYCWGSNLAGALGDGTLEHRSSPVAVAGGLEFGALSVGGYRSCGLTRAGTAYCWGPNSEGERGDGTTYTDFRTSPVAVVGGLTFARLSAGGGHNCALTSAGEAYCWGRNAYGQLGDRSIVERNHPVAVTGGLTFR